MATFFSIYGPPEALNAINELLFVFWLNFPTNIFFKLVPQVSIGLQSGDSGGVRHHIILLESKNDRAKRGVIVLHEAMGRWKVAVNKAISNFEESVHRIEHPSCLQIYRLL